MYLYIMCHSVIHTHKCTTHVNLYHRKVYITYLSLYRKMHKDFSYVILHNIPNFYALFQTTLISVLILLLINLNMECHNFFDLSCTSKMDWRFSLNRL